MKDIEIRYAKQALLGKSLLGYRSEAGLQVPATTAKVGAIKTEPARLVRTAQAKVGLDKPPPPASAAR